MLGKKRTIGDGTGFTLKNGTCNNFGDSGFGGISVGACIIGNGSGAREF